MQQLIPPCEPQRPDISFPTELLPEVLKRTVQNVVEAFRVPENIVGVQVLGLLSGCLGKSTPCNSTETGSDPICFY